MCNKEEKGGENGVLIYDKYVCYKIYSSIMIFSGFIRVYRQFFYCGLRLK
jgi:hypothetical protein